MPSVSGIGGYVENLKLMHGEFRAARDRIRDDWRIAADVKPGAVEEARLAFARQAAGLVRHVLGTPSASGLAGGVLWEQLDKAQTAIRAAYDKADAGTDYARLAYERARIPAMLSEYRNIGELEAALPTLGAYTRRALADAPEAVQRQWPGDAATGHVLAGLRRERDAAREAASAGARELAEAVVSDGVAFVEAARSAATDTDIDAGHIRDVLRHVTTEQVAEQGPQGVAGFRWRLSRRDAAPIDMSGHMSFGGEPGE